MQWTKVGAKKLTKLGPLSHRAERYLSFDHPPKRLLSPDHNVEIPVLMNN